LEEEPWASRYQSTWAKRIRSSCCPAPRTRRFTIGGIAFPIKDPAPEWILFWVGAGVALVGCFVLLFSKAMSTDWY
jgi:hypothetical protein